MGLLQSGGSRHHFDDRVLGHLARVIVHKLRRDEPFLLSWAVDAGSGSGRVMLWIDRSQAIEFHFDGSRQITINESWVRSMIDRSYRASGLELTSENDFERSSHPAPHSKFSTISKDVQR